MKFKIAVVQFEIKQFSPAENLAKAEKFIKKASLLKTNIIVFPEDFITGPIGKRLEFADSENKYRKIFQSLAKKYKLDIVPGTIIEKEKGGPFNTSYYIDSKGSIKARYRKVNLWHSERRYLNFGNEISVFNTKFGKIGLIICWDLIFPEIFRRMIKRGVNIVICPSFWCFGDAGKGIKYDTNAEIKLVNSLCTSRAFENEIVLVYCNAAGKYQLGKYQDALIGQSQITAPFKGALKKIAHNQEAMFIQEIDLAILKVAEISYKIRSDIKNRIL